jgi:hypothetical protein
MWSGHAKQNGGFEEALREALSEAMRNVHDFSGYMAAPDSARYMGLSLRTFETFAREIACYRVTERGKRLYRREDLDAFMEKHKEISAGKERVDALIDAVVERVVGRHIGTE